MYIDLRSLFVFRGNDDRPAWNSMVYGSRTSLEMKLATEYFLLPLFLFIRHNWSFYSNTRSFDFNL